jgi:pyridoxal phosphate enzyme (YggS family)
MRQVADGLDAVRARIAGACADVGRDPEDVTLVVVTKTFPASDVRLLAALGVRDVGENRDQEAAAKAGACADLGLTWHFVGQVQTNKAAAVARYADVVHSVDRERLVAALDRGAHAVGRRVRCLVQVALDDAPGRGGATPQLVLPLADRVAATESLDLAGVMAVAPLDADPGAAFARLADVASLVRADHPAATWISAGMSEDLEAAVRAGATHVRVGSAILGRRSATG